MRFEAPVLDGQLVPVNTPEKCRFCPASIPELRAIHEERITPYESKFEWELLQGFYVEPRVDDPAEKAKEVAWDVRKENMMGCMSPTWAEHGKKKQAVVLQPKVQLLEIRWMRHGQTAHNLIKFFCPEYYKIELCWMLFSKPDTPLNEKGIKDAEEVGRLVSLEDAYGHRPPEAGILVASRLKRTIETAELVKRFTDGQTGDTPIIPCEFLREELHCNPCDRSTPKSILQAEHQDIHFSDDVPLEDESYMCWTCRNRLAISRGELMEPEKEAVYREAFNVFPVWAEYIQQFERFGSWEAWFESKTEQEIRIRKGLDFIFELAEKETPEVLGVAGHIRMIDGCRRLLHKDLAPPTRMDNGEIRHDIVKFWRK